MQDDHVAVGEVVLGCKGVGRVDPDAGEEGGGAERGEPLPARQAELPLGYADQQDQRIHGQQVAGEQGSAEYGEGDPVGEQDDGDGVEDWAGKRMRVAMAGIAAQPARRSPARTCSCAW